MPVDSRKRNLPAFVRRRLSEQPDHFPKPATDRTTQQCVRALLRAGAENHSHLRRTFNAQTALLQDRILPTDFPGLASLHARFSPVTEHAGVE